MFTPLNHCSLSSPMNKTLWPVRHHEKATLKLCGGKETIQIVWTLISHYTVLQHHISEVSFTILLGLYKIPHSFITRHLHGLNALWDGRTHKSHFSACRKNFLPPSTVQFAQSYLRLRNLEVNSFMMLPKERCSATMALNFGEFFTIASKFPLFGVDRTYQSECRIIFSFSGFPERSY